MNTDQLHKKFQSYFGADYKKKDLPRICKFILRNIGQTTKDPVQEIKKHWGKACQFLNDWSGGKFKKQNNMQTDFDKFLAENFIYEKEVGLWYHNDVMTKRGSQGYNKSDIVKLYKNRVITKDSVTEEMKQIFAGKICPYCKKPSQYVDSKIIWGKSYGMIYYCQPCASWCGTHKDEPTKPLGRLANAELRELKKEAHAAFDPIWKSNMKSRHNAYTWLSQQLGIPRDYTHIGYFGVETCKKVITICKLELQ